MAVNYRGKFFLTLAPGHTDWQADGQQIPLRSIRSWQPVAVAVVEVEDPLNQNFGDVNDEETAAENLILTKKYLSFSKVDSEFVKKLRKSNNFEYLIEFVEPSKLGDSQI
jgi:hypothetical protein